jgi:hypothetical protein
MHDRLFRYAELPRRDVESRDGDGDGILGERKDRARLSTSIGSIVWTKCAEVRSTDEAQRYGGTEFGLARS